MTHLHVHTIICGTSKSLNENGYYIKEKEKFWGLIYKCNVTKYIIDPYDYKQFEDLGFKFLEIISSIESQDKKIFEKYSIDEIQNSIKGFVEKVETIKPKRIFFHGKKSAEWFLQYIENEKIRKKGYPMTKDRENGKIRKKGYLMTRSREYGKQSDLNLGYDIYILPSTSGAASKYWQSKYWEQAWKDSLIDINKAL
ncbi:MAG: hypothetical protein ABIJ40_06705 [Bacteroidota bacterium]